MKIASGKLKTILVAVIIFVLAVTMVACNYNPATNDGIPSGGGNDNNGGNLSGDDSSGTPSGSSEDVFTVRLSEKVATAYLIDIKVIWTDVESSSGAYYSANFDKDGVARVTGLDGDYKVTLSAIPKGYTYNPNIYVTNRDERDIVIQIFKLGEVSNPDATGLSSYDRFILKSTGAYRAVLTADNFENGLWFTYEPQTAGEYSLETLIDVTANKLCPMLDYHGGSFAFVNPTGTTIEGGGEESTYTKNVRWEMKVSGSQYPTFHFHIYATTLDKNVFPINVDFILERDGEYTDSGKLQTIEVEATHDFDAISDIAFSDYRGSFTAYYEFDGNNGLLDGSKVHYAGENAKSEAERKANDYYYVELADGTKKILYARITKDTGNSDTGVEIPTTDVITTDSATLFLDPMNAPKTVEGKDEKGQNRYYNYVGFIKTYAEYTNAVGCYPVTQELQLFLQRISITKRLFNDGGGVAESKGIMSSESNQWLWACVVFE